jgi:hypothetical protein
MPTVSHTVPPELRDLARRYADELGATGAARKLGVSRATLTAVLADVPVTAGVLALLRLAEQGRTYADSAMGGHGGTIA